MQRRRQQVQRLPGGPAGGGAGCEIKHPFAVPLAHGPKGRVQGADGFTDAGGGLHHQAAALAAGTVHLAGQGVLPGAELRKGKGQRRQILCAVGLPLGLPFGPGGVLFQQLLQKCG